MPIFRRCSAVLTAAALVAALGCLSPVRHVGSVRAAAPTSVPMATRLDTYLSGLAQAHTFSGAVLLARQGTILLSKGYGEADWQHSIPNTVDTEFAAPSIMGEFTVPAILHLEDTGKLRDSDHLCAFITPCPAVWAPITLHEVLNWTSAIVMPPNGSFSTPVSLSQLIALLSQQPLSGTPGKSCCFEYTSFPIEEYIVERVSGMTFGQYLQQHFLRPLRLTHTGYYLHLPGNRHLATSYSGWQTPSAQAMTGFGMSGSGGAMYSTVSDLYRWEQAVRSGHVLSSASTAKLTTPSFQLSAPDCCTPGWITAIGMSDGWSILTSVHAGRFAFLAGGWTNPAVFHTVEYYIDARITLIVLMNMYDGSNTVALPQHLETQIFG